jgi:toxin ParE1/3/4
VIVSVTPEARRELIDAASFYGEQGGAELGLAFIDEFEHARNLLSINPEMGAEWRVSARRLPLRRFPYSVIYQLRSGEVRIIALAHQRRRPGYWNHRR